MRRRTILVPAFIVVAALPCVLFLITPAEARDPHPSIAASGSASGSARPKPAPLPHPSGSASSWKK